MIIFCEYRKAGISENDQRLCYLDPDNKSNGLTKYNVNSDDLGTEELDVIFEMCKESVPSSEWELHTMYLQDYEQIRLNPFTRKE